MLRIEDFLAVRIAKRVSKKNPQTQTTQLSPLTLFWQVTSRAEENGHILNPATILASLLHSQEELEAAQARLKMSGLERDTATFIIEKRNIGEVDLKTVKCWWVDTKTKSPQKNKAILQEFIKYIGR